MRLGSRLLGTAALAAGLLTGYGASAQQAEGFTLNRLETSERGSDWFVVESLDLRGHQRFAAGLVLDYARKPLVLYDENGDEQTALVSDQLYGHVGGAVNLWGRLRIGLNVPVAIWQDGQGGQAGTVTVQPSGKTALGDVRVTGDVRILGEYGDPFTLAGGVRLYAPTGSQNAFTGDGNLRAAARAMGAGRIDWFTYGAGLNFDFRARDSSFAGNPRGSEVGFNAAAGAILVDDKLIVGPEIFGATVVTGSDSFFSKTSTPLEWLLGGHYRFHPDFQASLGGGSGLTRGFGTPQFRLLASLTWFERMEEEPPPPPPPPPDRDDDGILDDVDACPDEPGEPNDDPKKNGCPPPSDRDGDGIIDEVDACRDEPGIPTDDPTTNGCPDPDRDKDTILNEVDACPDDAGEANEDPKKNGCPFARVTKDKIEIREQVQFAYNSDRILKASDSILDAVRKILEENPQIKKVSIEGHTDDKGSDVYNRRLSDKRAAAVVKWLVKHGIDESRLESIGYGESMPIDSNDTEEGRANNRRVEIRIVEQDTGAPAEAAAPAAKPDAAAPEKTNPTPGGTDEKAQ